MRPEDAESLILGHLDRGDTRAAVAAAFQGYGAEVLGYVAAILRDRDLADAEEVAGELYCRLLDRVATYERRASFRAWMYRVARNLAYNFLERPGVRRVRRLETQEASAVAAAVRETTEAWCRTENKDALSRVRAQLDPEDQTLLILLVDRQLSSSEVAEVLSRPEERVTAASVRQRYKRLRERLRRMLEAEGVLGP